MASHQSSSPSSPKPASMTKEMLRNALIQHAVPLPDKSALKEELVRLYQEHVVPKVTGQGEFSSDDEVDVAESSDGLRLNFQPDEVTPYVKGLTNSQLYGYLKLFKISSGPVVASTRTLYENQVARLLAQQASSPATNGARHAPEESNGRNGFSDSDDDAAVETASRASRSSRASGIQSSQPQTPPTPSKRRQVRVSSSKQVASNSVSQPAVNTSTGHLLSEAEERRTRRSSARNTPTSDSAEDVGGGGENARPGPVHLSIFPRYGTPGTFAPSPSTASRQSRDLSSSLSYFRERPGYASATTSNVLPHKPSYSRDKSVEASQAKGGMLQSLCANARRCATYIVALGVVIVAVLLFMKMTSDYNAVPVSDNTEGDELDAILARLDDENKGGILEEQ